MVKMIKATTYTHRYLLRFILEAETPLALGSGEKDVITDSLAATDVNGFPYLPGTSIAGVVRSLFGNDKDLFGHQDGLKGKGSEILFTEGKIVDLDGNVMDGLSPKCSKEFKDLYTMLPVRQHVNIDGRGTASNKGKYDNQVVFAGTRFCFEVEILGNKFTKDKMEDVIKTINNKSFRLGSGSRHGYGQMKVVKYWSAEIDLRKLDQQTLYLKKKSNLNSEWEGWGKPIAGSNDDMNPDKWTKYELKLKADDFFLFGSGFGDEEGNADMTGVREKRISWDDEKKKGSIKESCVVIPASSLKGALRHRVAYHYNKKIQAYVGNEKAKEADENIAVEKLFGSNKDEKNLVRGNVLFSDIVKKSSKVQSKLINHNSIDRFTGGTIDGALFTELADYGGGEVFETEIYVANEALKDNDVKYAFNQSLIDIRSGMLPLGGGVNRGNGMFRGSVKVNEKELSHEN